MTTVLLFYVALFVLAAFALATAVSQEKDRNETFAKAALRVGMRYEPRHDALIEEYGILPLFSQGHSRRTANVLTGSTGDRPAAVFDYHYTTGSGKGASTHARTAAVFHLDGSALAAFTMEPEGALQRLTELFGYKDVDFEHQPEFSRAYFLRGQDVEAMRRLFQPALLAQLQQMTGWRVEGTGDRLAVYRGERVKPEELPMFIEQTARIAQLFRDAGRG